MAIFISSESWICNFRIVVSVLDDNNSVLLYAALIKTVCLNAQIPKTPGPTQINGSYCYQTYYSQSCSGANCSIGAWFSNPCQGTSYYGVSTFAMPTTVNFTDTWDDQCAALEARAQ
jgi:hypothetical protein